MSIQHDIDALSEAFKRFDDKLWRELGWMHSDLNHLEEDEDKERMGYLVTAARVFLRAGQFGVAVRDEVTIALEIAKVSCAQQGYRPRTNSADHLRRNSD